MKIQLNLLMEIIFLLFFSLIGKNSEILCGKPILKIEKADDVTVEEVVCEVG